MGLLLLSSDVDAPVTVATADGPLLPWLPEAVQHTMQWRTDVLKAHDGTEHRIGCLPLPRERFELSWLLDDAQMRELRDALLLSPDQTFLVPLPHESEAITAGFTATTLFYDQTYTDWTQVGRALLVMGPDGTYHECAITAIDAGSVTVTPTISPASLPLGARVYPLAALYLSNGAPIARWPVSLGAMSLSGAIAQLFPAIGTGAAAVTEYDDLPVLDEPPINTEQVQEAAEAGVQLLDYGGTIVSAWGREVGDLSRGVRLLLKTRPERQWAKLLLDTLRGRQCAFLLPTWRPDLIVLAGASGGDDTLDLESNDTFNASPSHTRIQIVYANGTVSYHTIVTATDNLDGSHTVEFDPVFHAAVDIDCTLSWLELCHLASDEATWTHRSACSWLNLAALVVQQ